MLPNFIIAGTNKGGTTSLFRYLASHPDVCSSAVKETCYFLPIRYGYEVKPLSDYAKHFEQHNQENIVMESTPGYFYGSEKLVQKMHESLPDLRICLIFRNPVTRFFSFFHFMKAMQCIDENMTSEEYLTKCMALNDNELKLEKNNAYFGFEGGNYSNYLKPWIDTFGDKLQICFFENMVDNPRYFMQGICEFLGLDPSYFERVKFPTENSTRKYTNHWLHSIALSGYRKHSKLLNSNPLIKNLLSTIYFRLNASPISKRHPNEQYLSDMLMELYRSKNAAFKGQIVEAGSSINVNGNIPDWLK